MLGYCTAGQLRWRSIFKWRTTRTASRPNTGEGYALLSLIRHSKPQGELHSPPRQGNARLTHPTTAPLNIIDRPVFTFTNITTALPSTSSGR